MNRRENANDESFPMFPAAIRKDVPIPYYYQLKELLLEAIKANRWEVGSQIPSERELCESFGLSRATVRQAIDTLVNEGVLRREKGRGTFVAQPKIVEGLVESPKGFYDDMTGRGIKVDTQVLRFELEPASPSVAGALGVEEKEPLIVIDRLRLIDNEPILIVTSYVPYRLCPDLLHDDLAVTGLYRLLEDKYGIRIVRAKRYMEAVLANEFEAQVLGIDIGAPLMLIESTAYLQSGQGIEHFKAKHRGDRTRFLVESYTNIVRRQENNDAPSRKGDQK